MRGNIVKHVARKSPFVLLLDGEFDESIPFQPQDMAEPSETAYADCVDEIVGACAYTGFGVRIFSRKPAEAPRVRPVYRGECLFIQRPCLASVC